MKHGSCNSGFQMRHSIAIHLLFTCAQATLKQTSLSGCRKAASPPLKGEANKYLVKV